MKKTHILWAGFWGAMILGFYGSWFATLLGGLTGAGIAYIVYRLPNQDC